MLTHEQLYEAVVEHFDAEMGRDLDGIIDTVTPDVEYHVKSPRYVDDPEPFGVTASAEGVRDLWKNLYETFSDYQIEIDDVLTWPERNQALALVTITATPAEEFEGLPAGVPYTYSVAALCDYDDNAKMTKETVYGNMAIVTWGIRRMHEFLAEQAGGRMTASVNTPYVDIALEAAQAALTVAEGLDARIAVVVLDSTFTEAALLRMDGAFASAVAVARAKACTAVNFGAPSSTMAERVSAENRAALVAVEPRLMFVGGGIPIRSGDRVVGGLGVSGSSEANDVAIAEAAATSVAHLLVP